MQQLVLQKPACPCDPSYHLKPHLGMVEIDAVHTAPAVTGFAQDLEVVLLLLMGCCAGAGHAASWCMWCWFTGAGGELW